MIDKLCTCSILNSTRFTLSGLILVNTVLLSTALAQTADLRGFVSDQSNGEPLQGVNVVVESGTGTFLGNVTNGDGIYVISRVPEGRYTLRVSYIGYRIYSETITLSAGERRNLNIALEPEGAELGELLVESERGSGAKSWVELQVPLEVALESLEPNLLSFGLF